MALTRRTPLRRSGQLKRSPLKTRGGSSPFWQKRRRELFLRCGGRCEYMDIHSPDGRCRMVFGPKGQGMDAAHVKPLGMGRKRHRADDPLNDLSNLLALCRRHHEEMERARLMHLAREKGLR
jgi:hypothetical protein